MGQDSAVGGPGTAASGDAHQCQRVWEKEPAHVGSWDERVQPAGTRGSAADKIWGGMRPNLLRASPG